MIERKAATSWAERFSSSLRFTGFADEAGKTLEEQIAVVEEAGWKAIELRLISGSNVCDLDDAEWESVCDLLDERGIEIVGLGGQIANWSRPVNSDFRVDLDELKRCAPRMKQMGIEIIRIMSYPNQEDAPWSTDEWKNEVFRRLRELAHIAEDHGVFLGHENCSGYGGIGPSQYLETVEAVSSPAFKLIFDTGNNSLHDNDLESTWSFYEACKEEIIHVHIKAAKPGPDGPLVPCYPDQDPVQERILSDLAARDYDGWLSIEPHMAAAIHLNKDVEDPETARRVWLDYARRLEQLVAGTTDN